MGNVTAIFLVLLALILFFAARKGWIHKETLEQLAYIAGIVALVAAILIFVIPAATSQSSAPTSTSVPYLKNAATTPTSGSPTFVQTLSLTPAPTLTLSPAQTTVQVTTPTSSFVGFDFETGIEGWNTAEGSYKLATVNITTQVVHSGKQALEVDTELFGSGSSQFAAHNKDDIYRHTEADGYFSGNIPEGFNQPGPYDLTAKQISCFVYLPTGLDVEGAPSAYVRLIVKDAKFANQFSKAVDVTKDNVNQWLDLSLVVSKSSPDSDPAFDPTQINAIGVRLDSLDGSTVAYTGPIYIDDCQIK